MSKYASCAIKKCKKSSHFKFRRESFGSLCWPSLEAVGFRCKDSKQSCETVLLKRVPLTFAPARGYFEQPACSCYVTLYEAVLI